MLGHFVNVHGQRLSVAEGARVVDLDQVASLLAGSSWLSAKAVDIQYPSKAV